MNQEFKKISNKTETRYILESMTAGATGGGAIATSEKPVGEVQARSSSPTPRSPVARAAQKVAKGSGAHKNPAKTIPRKEKHKGREVSEADFDPNRLKMIQNKIKQSKGGTPLRRDEKGELSDLMKGFSLDRLKKAMSGQTSEGGEPDHEISMAGSELHSIYQDAKQLHAMIKHYSEMDGLDAWQQSKITKAADYLNSVLQSLQHEVMGESERTMSRAAKGMMKYGKDGMRALAKAGREGASEKQLDTIRDKNNNYSEGWSQKYKNSINCSHPKGFSQKAHCAGKRKHTESIAMEMTCPDCGMCETHGDNMMEVKQRLDAKCWKGKHKEGTKIKGGIRVNNCVPNESIQESEKRCMQCGMTNCSCPPGKCKCKPIAGWMPGKGFKKDVAEGGPFSYGKPPRKGSVADLAAKRRQEQDRKTPPIEPKDQMVGNAKVTKDTKEGLKQMLRKVDPTIKSRLRRKADDLDYEGDEVHQDLKSMGMEPHDAMTRNMDPEKYYRNADRYRRLADKDVDETQLAELDRPSGKLFIIVKADNAGATHVFGDFGSFPQDVMHKISKRGTRDKSGAKTKLKIDFLFDNFRSTIQQLRMIFRDVDFVGAEAAEFIIHSSALRSDQGEDVKQLRDYIEAGDDRRMKIYQAPEDDEEDDGETTGGNLPRAKKPQTQMGGKSTEQPGMTTYQFKDPIFARRVRGMNLGFNIKGDSITVDQKQKQKLLSMLGNKFGDVFADKEKFREQDSYLESLAATLAEKLTTDMTVDQWRDDFKAADPNRYHQFRNKTPEKKERMADAARYSAIQKR